MEKYIQKKKEYNSKLSTFQIDKDLHKKVKEFCKLKNIKVKNFLEKIIQENIK
jgi:hypothetical protein